MKRSSPLSSYRAHRPPLHCQPVAGRKIPVGCVAETSTSLLRITSNVSSLAVSTPLSSWSVLLPPLVSVWTKGSTLLLVGPVLDVGVLPPVSAAHAPLIVQLRCAVKEHRKRGQVDEYPLKGQSERYRKYPRPP